jgi:hypothetical protein
MKLSTLDQQYARQIVAGNPGLIEGVIDATAESAHAEEDFLGDTFNVTMFLEFCASVAAVVGVAAKVVDVVEAVERLFGWLRKSRGGNSQTADLTVRERVLTLLFEAYVNRNTGVSPAQLAGVLGAPADAVEQALMDLSGLGLARKSRRDTWRYVTISR